MTVVIDSRIQNIKCIILPGHIRDCKPEYLELYNRVYEFWHYFMGMEMRSENLTELTEKLASDGFMLFGDIYVLVYMPLRRDGDKAEAAEKREIVGIFCFDDKDVTSSAVLGQSYFKHYPKDILRDYILPSKKVMTIGHLLVHPEWRRSKIGIGLSDILVWFMHQRFLDSGANLMIYFTRNNRGTNDLGKKFGGKAILKNCEYGGLTADIIATKPEDVIMDCGDAAINQLSSTLYDSKMELKISIASQSQ